MNNIYRKIILSALNQERLSWDVLRQCPEFDVLYGNEENARYHQEGTTDKHLDLMMDILFNDFKTLNSRDFIINYLCILFHDLRKPDTKSIGEDGLIHNYRHEQLGARYWWDFLFKAYQGKQMFPMPDMFFAVSDIIFHHMNKKLDFYTTARSKYCLANMEKHGLNAFATFLHIDNHGAIGPHPKPTKDEYLNAFKVMAGKYDVYTPKKTSPTLTTLIGPSAAGKSTFAATLDGRTISTDQLRIEILGDVADQTQNEKIFAAARKLVVSTLQEGQNAIVDATNLTYKNRKEFLNLAFNLSIPCAAHVFLTPFAQCIDRQRLRDRKVPVDIIKRQYEKLEPASHYEFHAITYHFN